MIGVVVKDHMMLLILGSSWIACSFWTYNQRRTRL